MSDLGTILLVGGLWIAFCAVVGWRLGGVIAAWVDRWLDS